MDRLKRKPCLCVWDPDRKDVIGYRSLLSKSEAVVWNRLPFYTELHRKQSAELADMKMRYLIFLIGWGVVAVIVCLFAVGFFSVLVFIFLFYILFIGLRWIPISAPLVLLSNTIITTDKKVVNLNK